MLGMRASVCIQGLLGSFRTLPMISNSVCLKPRSRLRGGVRVFVGGPWVEVAGGGGGRGPCGAAPGGRAAGGGVGGLGVVPADAVVLGQAEVLVDRPDHGLLLGRDSLHMSQLEPI